MDFHSAPHPGLRAGLMTLCRFCHLSAALLFLGAVVPEVLKTATVWGWAPSAAGLGLGLAAAAAVGSACVPAQTFWQTSLGLKLLGEPVDDPLGRLELEAAASAESVASSVVSIVAGTQLGEVALQMDRAAILLVAEHLQIAVAAETLVAAMAIALGLGFGLALEVLGPGTEEMQTCAEGELLESD